MSDSLNASSNIVKGTRPRKVDRDRIKNYFTDNLDAYLAEIASDFGCHPTTIHYALKAMGYTRKKNYIYYEQDVVTPKS